MCKYCENLEEMCWECPDEPHHGAVAYCDECEAEYYEEWMGDYNACNDKAKENHPELKVL